MKHFFLVFFTFVAAQAFTIEPKDQKAITQVIERYTASWNASAGVGFGADFTQDADFVNIFGMAFSGKEEIEERHVAILDTFLGGTILTITDVQMREQRPDLVVAKVYWELDREVKRGPIGPVIKKGIFLQTFVKEKGAWKICASQNTLITP